MEEYQYYLYITRLASNEIFSPSNKIHREVVRAKDLSACRYWALLCNLHDTSQKELTVFI
jgi:hypothetical protein